VSVLEKKNIQVRILDKIFNIACPEHEEPALLETVRYVEEEMRHIRSTGRVIGLERIAVMAALNVTHELLKYKNSKDDYIETLGQRLKELQDKIDGVLAEAPISFDTVA
jgi:cell division protein ZapA